ncbi:MAG: hypothetical protein QXY23_00440 [Ignisphaera sp.]
MIVYKASENAKRKIINAGGTVIQLYEGF